MDVQMPAYQKQSQRKAGISARKALTNEQRRAYSAAICQRVESLPVFQAAQTVLLYAAFGAEASVDALALSHPEKRFFWPVCLPEYHMRASRPLEESGWEVGAYGIRTPVLERSECVKPEELDLVLVPCTAFDKACRRVGMGKGYYDRYLARCSRAVKAGIAFECQRVEQAAVDAFDQRLDLYVTEQSVYIRLDEQEEVEAW